MSLQDFSDFEIEQEYNRRKAERLISHSPIFTCGRCGIKVYFIGVWNPIAHERQVEAAKHEHSNCPMGAML